MKTIIVGIKKKKEKLQWGQRNSELDTLKK